MTEVLPLLYLRGLSTSDFGPALEQFLGSSAGLSATTITRLTAQWQDEAKAFGKRDLSGADYVYLWVDGNCDGLQAHRRCASPLAGRQRPASGRPRPRRRRLPPRQTPRTTHRHHPACTDRRRWRRDRIGGRLRPRLRAIDNPSVPRGSATYGT